LGDPGVLTDGLASVLEQLADSCFVADREGRILYANAAFEALTGYSRDELIGQRANILRSGVHPETVYEELWRTLQDGRSFRFIFTNRRKDGVLYEEDVILSPLRSAGGQVVQVLSIGRAVDQFRQTYDVFTLLANSSPSAVYILQNGRFFFANQHFLDYTGYAAEELIGKEWSELVATEDRERALAESQAMLTARRTAPYEYRILDKYGRGRWVLESVRTVDFRGIESVNGSFVTGNLIDITDRKLAEQRLKEALSLYAATVESTADGIVILDLGGKIAGFNTRFLDMWRFSAPSFSRMQTSEVLAAILAQVKHPDEVRRYFRETQEHTDANATFLLDLNDGRIFELYSKPQTIEGAASGRVWSFRDVTERQQSEAMLLHMARYDSLTGLLNRRGFQEELEQSLKTMAGDGLRGALFLLDIDRFKDVNDTLGHQAGDEVLFQLAGVLKETMTGHVVSRFGGDEFAVILTGVGARGARSFAEKLIRTLQTRTFVADGADLAISVSIGAALFPNHGETVRDLLSRADLAMYEAKARGGDNLTTYSPRFQTRGRMQARREWQNRLRDAIENERLALYSQPIVRLSNQEPEQHELLVRFRSAEGAFLPARHFIPTAEQVGLIQRIDRWVVRGAVNLLKEMELQGNPVPLALNLSGWAFADLAMLDFLRLALRDADVNPSLLIVELSETTALSDIAKASRFVEALRALGCRFALDDFGGGYSSMRHLSRLSVDYLKIDASFIREIRRSHTDRQIVRAMVNLARGLGIRTVAEGVHDEATLDAVREIGVDCAQGYRLGRPRPVAALLAGRIASKAA